MSPKAERNHLIARYIVMLGLFAAIVMLALSVVANRQTIHEIQHDRTVRIGLINQAALTLCGYSRQNRVLQRKSILEQTDVVTARFRLTGATEKQIAAVRVLAQARTNALMLRYPPIVCPSTFVSGRD